MVKLLFYPVSVDYRLAEERMYVQLFGRTEDGRQLCVQDGNFQPYFYVMAEGSIEEAAQKIKALRLERQGQPVRATGVDIDEKRYLGKKVRLIKVSASNPQDLAELSKEISAKQPGMRTFEDDIPITRRYLLDNDLPVLSLAEAEGDFINQRSRVSVFNASSVLPYSSDTPPKLNILTFELLAKSPEGKDYSPAKNPLIMASFSGPNFSKVLVTKEFLDPPEPVEFVETEPALLRRIEEIIAEQKPDLIVGLNSDSFDLPYLSARASNYGIRLDLGLDYTLLKAEKKPGAKSAIAGICHLDLSQFIRKTLAPTLKTQNLDLSSVSRELIGKGLKEMRAGRLDEAYDKRPEELSRFCERSLQKTILIRELSEALLPTLAELARLVGIPLFDISRMAYSQLAEWYLIKRAIQAGELVPEKPSQAEMARRRAETFQGGLVYQPEPGLYHDIAVLDFRSLYPTIIVTHNISPDTLRCQCCEGKNQAPDEKDWFCRNKKGFISGVIEELISRRQRVNDIIQAGEATPVLFARQQVLKTLANAMYGYLGFFMARWYSIESVRSITSYGRYYIANLMEKAGKEGFQVIYGDTDSVFLSLSGKTRDEAQKFVDAFNLDLPHQMELAIQGFYIRGLFVPSKTGQAAAKKRYAMLSDSDELVIRGFESVRRNSSRIARQTQFTVLGIILREEDINKAVEYVRNVIEGLRNHEIPTNQLVIYTALQKTVSEYETISPHVAVAKRMQEQGIEAGPGTIIRYVICAEGELVRDRARLPSECKKEDYDADYYINNQVLPAVEKIFEALGSSVEELISGKDQSRLDLFLDKK